MLFQKSTWLIFLILCLPLLARASEETQTEQAPTNATQPNTNSTKDLFASETADPKKVDIVKQIRRLNEDGSYTVGYEAGDGTFKIESRDVQGNIKGTFGYVDGDGEIKRVSYSTSNTTQTPFLVPSVQTVQTTRFNRTSSPITTRRPSPTIVYPKSSSNPTRATVIQAIPRKRPLTSSTNSNLITTTESYRVVSSNQMIPNTSDDSPRKQFPIFTPRTTAETIKAALLSEAEQPKIFHQNGQQRMPLEIITTTTSPNLVRSTSNYEKNPDRPKDTPKFLRANTFRRQLNPAQFENEQMFAIQQSVGDDTTDVYGGSIAIGTSRPLFTTTTVRPRLVPIHTILASRQKLNERLATNAPHLLEEQQETTLEATTNKIEAEDYVTTNPIPILQLSRDLPQRVIERPFLKPALAQFRTREFLRDNPGAPVPIGNQRILFRYNPNVEENGQYVRQPIPPQIPPPANLIPVSNHIQNDQPDHGQRYQVFNNPYMRVENIPQRVPPPIDEYRPIKAPVSTKDLKRLLHQLLIRQNRLQTLMDIRNDYRPTYDAPYNPQTPIYEQDYRQRPVYTSRAVYPNQYNERGYNGYQRQVAIDPNYQYQSVYPNQQLYRQQDEGYRNEVTNFDPSMPYESQRYVPKRRLYRPRAFDPRYEEMNTVAEHNEDQIEYLPPDVRESLLLKMLMLAINPDFNPQIPEPPVVAIMTTPQPEYRKKVRNVQILGEEGSTKDNEHKRHERT
jgi:hypothetical protein